MDHSALLNASLDYIRQHCAQHENQFTLVSSCAAFLKEKADISDATASRIAVQALGEFDRDLHDCYIDIDASTSNTIIIKGRKSGLSYAFTAARLLLLRRCHAIPIPS
jgi:hypothetical protein